MSETKHFVNDGYGWACKFCLARTNVGGALGAGERARFFREGEAEERDPSLSAQALARWRDESRQILFCPRCGSEERVDEKDR